MSVVIASTTKRVIVGLGVTGLSVARFLKREGKPFSVLDTRTEPPELAAFQNEFPTVEVLTGPLSQTSSMAALLSADELIVSPGIALATPEIQQALNQGAQAIGDIELFARYADAPIIAITGSNGKSTVTTLVGEMAKNAGLHVAVGGNIGVPALNLLADANTESPDFYVLELSSFQLETTEKLGAKVVTVLNISADHMDRYSGLPAYHAAKMRICFGAERVIANRDDPLTNPPLAEGVARYSFGLGIPDRHGVGLIEQNGEPYLAFEFTPLMPVSEMAMVGQHNVANALAALALGHAAGLDWPPMLETLKTFTGLRHRCETVARVNNTTFINDSKATNVGAALAAVNGLGNLQQPNLVVLVGGEGKGADFLPLVKALQCFAKFIVVIGGVAQPSQAALTPAEKSNGVLLQTLQKVAYPESQIAIAHSLEQAVCIGSEQAQDGDIVLLSPAAASFGWFENFMIRGDAFVDAVNALVKNNDSFSSPGEEI
ncbi:UDP-N-acetylmuramoyl-L-alanine--D-glutamate ligase [Marinibactrum halimedae]|uniref:UDP-N-acetylmuramoylalanine--D-glutamate ligase n=1 Tax=Marinibactrum halimedae TaxID=1444977 RepID=A0AA37WL38_9GAMM|nr:UDP-N-acetylmuramoyl-L-alanine--D-glutamate ligase [Marinibactrum halimedae]MCD9459603.1 UDP-N-acetylmuramoyl-L-alanine--D-glutamate ligase [Marinibactrum halimedae]GLS25579.1 UDP-N-acetylmuramoylalanine--D-glutamate ligase [Marinibactrum halimedae]